MRVFFRLTKLLLEECMAEPVVVRQIADICVRYENMLLLPTADTLLNNVQRQGKISFYMTSVSRQGTGP